MKTINDVHQQFAEFFRSETLKPYAYLVSKKLAEGHICLNLNEVEEELADNPFYEHHNFLKSQPALKSEGLVTTEGGPKQPFVLHNDRLYLQRYFKYESEILARIQLFIAQEKDGEGDRIASIEKHAALITALFARKDGDESNEAIENIDWQLIAALSAVINNFTIITGGPGTGKTTTVAKILAILYTINPALKVALAAPTGKAAVRMAESLKSAALTVSKEINEKFQSMAPGTIHRLLKYIPGSPYFRHYKDNPVNYDVVIVDESSMIDVALFAKLLNAIGAGTKLILLGDKDQLASVEAGSLFGDLCKTQPAFSVSTEKRALTNSLITNSASQIPEEFVKNGQNNLLDEHIIELKRSRRFSSDKGIGKFSKAIINNDVTLLQEYLQLQSDDQVLIDKDYKDEVFEDFINGYKEYIKEADIKKAIQKLNKLRVLCAVREGDQGLYKLNERIEDYLRHKKLLEKNTEFYNNRPIIITKNYYSLGLFNGDVGLVRPDENGILKAWFEDTEKGLKSVLPGYIAEAETVFAMTIHKSQGSEYDQVMVVLPNNLNISILTRELLYTGVTRAKTKVVVQASEEVIIHTAAGVVKRASGIMDRFEE